VDEWRVLQKEICAPDTLGLAPFLFRPGTEGMMFQSRVRINNLGFRGPDIQREKGNAYRIVTLGESTTFGHTINADDVSWPRVLERMIREELKPRRPVQVINAGIPSYTVRLNVRRLAKQILPLKPDMIISYHGYNGFMWLNPALPPSHGKGPPPYEERPLKLLADCEYRLKMMAYRRSRLAPVAVTDRMPADPMQTEYARAYRDLFRSARTNGIQLVIANYAMAVNAQSDPDVVNFYRAAFPQVLSQIKANAVHSQIVAELAEAYPEIRLVDTHPGLDGEHEKFIDLVHFTQEGREQLARVMFHAIMPVLQDEL
jgi:lysophospholipase L1-like esterase